MTKRASTKLIVPALANTRQFRPSAKRILAVLTRDAFTCVYCEASGVAMNVDHVRPASWFVVGTPRAVVNASNNLVSACETCNMELKGGLDLEAFARKLRAVGVRRAAVNAMRKRVAAALAKKLPKV